MVLLWNSLYLFADRVGKQQSVPTLYVWSGRLRFISPSVADGAFYGAEMVGVLVWVAIVLAALVTRVEEEIKKAEDDGTDPKPTENADTTTPKEGKAGPNTGGSNRKERRSSKAN